jgi:hypothetical protein
MGKAVPVEFLPLFKTLARKEMRPLRIGTRRTLAGGEFIFEDDWMFRCQSSSEAVNSETGDQDGQMSLIVSSSKRRK